MGKNNKSGDLERLIHQHMAAQANHPAAAVPGQMIPVVTVERNGETFQFAQNPMMLLLYYMTTRAQAGDKEAQQALLTFQVDVTDVHGKMFCSPRAEFLPPADPPAPDLGGEG